MQKAGILANHDSNLNRDPKRDRGRTHGPAEQHLLDSAVDRLVGEWQSVIPSLDPNVRAIAARIARIDERLRAHTAEVLKKAELSDNEYRLIAALLRIGKPHRAAPTDIAGRYVPVTSGGLTGLARRLEARNLIRRVSHPRDQRSSLIELTAAGHKLALETMANFVAVEKLLMGQLSEQDRQLGNAFLQKLLHSIEVTLR